MAKARPLRACATPGCPELTDTRHCPEHTPQAWAGSNRRNELPKNWPTIRERIKRRDDHRCVICGSPHQLEVDHIGDKNDHTPTNLRTLCHDCHDQHTKVQAAQGRAANHW